MFAWVRKLERKQWIGAAAAILLAGAALFVFLWEPGEQSDGGLILETTEGSAATEDALTVQPEKTPELMVIDVEGAVIAPGVVEAAVGCRVYEAVALAGGVSGEADTSAVNLARVLNDGELIRIPTKQEAAAGNVPTVDQSVSEGKVNLNTADSETLQQLTGVGPSTAERILADRKENGPYRKIEDLKRVSGIGEKTFAKLKDKISVH